MMELADMQDFGAVTSVKVIQILRLLRTAVVGAAIGRPCLHCRHG